MRDDDDADSETTSGGAKLTGGPHSAVRPSTVSTAQVAATEAATRPSLRIGIERGIRPIRSVNQLAATLARDPQLAEAVKADPIGTIAKIAGPPLETDVWIYRLVVGALGLTVLTAVVGAIVLAAMGAEGRKVPEVLVALGSAAVGALAGLLAPSPARRA